MARNGAGVYSLPAGSTVANGDTSDASDINVPLADLETDMNTPRPVVAGGTGASTAANARANLGLTIGTNVQAYDAGLQSIAGLTTAADKMIYTTASDTYAVTDLTAAGRALLDDANAAAQLVTLGAQAADATLTSLSGLSLAEGDILYATAADTLQRLAKGTGGQHLVMNAGATAPAWASGSRVLLATKTASASATLDFTEFNNSVYRRYEFEIENILPATDGETFGMRVSTNAGSAYDAGASDYAWSYNGAAGVSFFAQASAATLMRLSGAVGNAANENGVTGLVTLWNAPSATQNARITYLNAYDNTSTENSSVAGSGRRLTAQDTDAVRFLFGSGNITSGTIRMYGIV